MAVSVYPHESLRCINLTVSSQRRSAVLLLVSFSLSVCSKTRKFIAKTQTPGTAPHLQLPDGRTSRHCLQLYIIRAWQTDFEAVDQRCIHTVRSGGKISFETADKCVESPLKDIMSDRHKPRGPTSGSPSPGATSTSGSSNRRVGKPNNKRKGNRYYNYHSRQNQEPRNEGLGTASPARNDEDSKKKNTKASGRGREKQEHELVPSRDRENEETSKESSTRPVHDMGKDCDTKSKGADVGREDIASTQNHDHELKVQAEVSDITRKTDSRVRTTAFPKAPTDEEADGEVQPGETTSSCKPPTDETDREAELEETTSSCKPPTDGIDREAELEETISSCKPPTDETDREAELEETTSSCKPPTDETDREGELEETTSSLKLPTDEKADYGTQSVETTSSSKPLTDETGHVVELGEATSSKPSTNEEAEREVEPGETTSPSKPPTDEKAEREGEQGETSDEKADYKEQEEEEQPFPVKSDQNTTGRLRERDNNMDYSSVKPTLSKEDELDHDRQTAAMAEVCKKESSTENFCIPPDVMQYDDDESAEKAMLYSVQSKQSDRINASSHENPQSNEITDYKDRMFAGQTSLPSETNTELDKGHLQDCANLESSECQINDNKVFRATSTEETPAESDASSDTNVSKRHEVVDRRDTTGDIAKPGDKIENTANHRQLDKNDTKEEFNKDIRGNHKDTEENGADVEENGDDKEEAGKDIDDNCKDIEENGKEVEKKGSIVKENCEDRKEIGKDKEKNGKDMEENGKDMEENCTIVKENDKDKEEIGKDMEDNGEFTEENVTIVVENVTIVEENGKDKQEIGKDMEDTGKNMAENGTDVEDNDSILKENVEDRQEIGKDREENGRDVEENGINVEENCTVVNDNRKDKEDIGKDIEEDGPIVMKNGQTKEDVGKDRDYNGKDREENANDMTAIDKKMEDDSNETTLTSPEMWKPLLNMESDENNKENACEVNSDTEKQLEDRQLKKEFQISRRVQGEQCDDKCEDQTKPQQHCDENENINTLRADLQEAREKISALQNKMSEDDDKIKWANERNIKLEAEKAKWEQEKAALQEKIMTCKQEADELKNNHQELKDHFLKSQLQLEKDVKENRMINSTYLAVFQDALKRANDAENTLTTEKNRLTENIALLERRLSEAVNLREKAEKHSASLEQKCGQHQSSIDHLREETRRDREKWENNSQWLQSQLNEVTGQKDKATQRVAMLEQTNREHECSINHMMEENRREKEKWISEMSALLQEKRVFEEKSVRLTDECRHLTDQLQESMTSQVKMNQYLTSLEETCREKQDICDQLRNESRENFEKSERLKDEIVSLQAETQSLRQEKLQITNNFQWLQSQLNEVTGQKDEVTQRIAILEQTNREHELQIASLRKEKDTAVKDNVRAKGEISACIKDKETYQRELNQVSANMASVKREAEQLRETNEQLITKLNFLDTLRKAAQDTVTALGQQSVSYEMQAAQARAESQELKRQLDTQTIHNKQLTDQVQQKQRQELTLQLQVERDRQIIERNEAQLREARDLVKSREEQIAGLQAELSQRESVLEGARSRQSELQAVLHNRNDELYRRQREAEEHLRKINELEQDLKFQSIRVQRLELRQS